MMLTPERLYEEELLDAGAGTDEDVRRNLKDLRRVNRYLGGTKTVLRALSSIIEREKIEELSLLDVGTGSADIPTAVVEWCGARGIESFIAALDISERNLRIARTRLGISSEVKLIRADSLKLPFGDRSFDFMTASLFMHHFRDEDVVRLLRDFARVARRAIIINDLVRNLIPYYFAKLTGPLLATSFLTRNDGPVSVLRGFTADELKQLAERAGLRRFTVRRVFPYRLLLIAENSRQ
ncbi:MAG TPA: methyltransferase domain-containing protein [Blastocatellia bacterium]|nr:methyltransferase domain-containing protein [Blastocatellia bacterium]